MPFPYRHENGNICCSSRTACCPRCQAKLAAETLGLRSATDYAPPEPYAAGIAKLKKETA